VLVRDALSEALRTPLHLHLQTPSLPRRVDDQAVPGLSLLAVSPQAHLRLAESRDSRLASAETAALQGLTLAYQFADAPTLRPAGPSRGRRQG
jgi:hypothetical protein